MKTEKKLQYREAFPSYSGHVPYKKEALGMTVGATNDYIKTILSREPEKEDILVPSAYSDYSYYNKDYFNGNFSKEYNLEEENIYSNHSKDANTWVCGTKFAIYPQHIPGKFIINNISRLQVPCSGYHFL